MSRKSIRILAATPFWIAGLETNIGVLPTDSRVVGAMTNRTMNTRRHAYEYLFVHGTIFPASKTTYEVCRPILKAMFPLHRLRLKAICGFGFHQCNFTSGAVRLIRNRANANTPVRTVPRIAR